MQISAMFSMVTLILAGVVFASAQWYQPARVNPYQNMIVSHIAQDTIGNFGYATADGQSRQQTVAPDGSVQGSYSYVDANGKPITVKYIADRHGYRAVGDNVPGQIQAAAPVQHAGHWQGYTAPYQHASYATRPRVNTYNPAAEAQLAQTIQQHALRDQDAQRKQLQQLSAITGTQGHHAYNPYGGYHG